MSTPAGVVPQATTDAITRIKAAGAAAAAKIKTLKDQISTAMTADEVAAVTGELNTLAESLEAATADTPPSP